MSIIKAGALCSVSAAALIAATAATAQTTPDVTTRPDPVENTGGRYVSGDFHNHTVCSDGSTSVDVLVEGSLSYLDWFIMAGHSGDGSRDCRFNDPGQSGLINDATPNGTPAPTAPDDRVTWSETGVEILGSPPPSNPEEMWRWQALSQFTYPLTAQESITADKPAFIGVEWVVPGHEHASASVIAGQYPQVGDSLGLSHFEYCFARNSGDTGGGFTPGNEAGFPETNWTCEISDASNNELIARYQNDPDQGTADYNSTLFDSDGNFIGVNTSDGGEHVKSTAGVIWMQETYPGQSYAAPAHVERQGAYIADDNEGYNIEHLRDWNTAGPDVAFGFESEPGHQGQFSRGSYNAGRPTVGFFTYGGIGCYAAAEASQPGHNFDGTPIDRATQVCRDVADGEVLAPDDPAHVGQANDNFCDFTDPDLETDPNLSMNKITVCRPGVRTAWDAMLSEGRRYWTFASSDWHNRGSFPWSAHQTTNDFIPGEFQKTYTFVRTRNPDDPAQDIVDGLRSGNVFTVQGDLISQLSFVACYNNTCATMGETLTVPAGADVQISMRFTDPRGVNNSFYDFPNPLLAQIGEDEPVNQPSVRQVDFITGVVTGLIPANLPSGDVNPDYKQQLAPDTTVIAKTFTADGPDAWRGRGPTKRISFVWENVSTDSYIRARGTNLPAGLENARDLDGNPLPDNLRSNIPCASAGCPDHIGGFVNADVEAWSDLWFMANPIFIEVEDTTASAN